MPTTDDRKDPGLKVTDENGMQEKYLVLSEEERTFGWTRPYRDSYVHLPCGGRTTMGRAIAETYAKDPRFYGSTYCSTCRKHFKVGEYGEFVWSIPFSTTPLGQSQKVGT